MDLRTMNRRTLCKTLVALALGGLTGPFKYVGAAEPVVKPVSEAHRASGVRKNEQKFFVCILRRQPAGKCETFLKNM